MLHLPLAGGMQDYNYVRASCYELTLELSCCKYPSPAQLPAFWEANRDALITFLFQVHMGESGAIAVWHRSVPHFRHTSWHSRHPLVCPTLLSHFCDTVVTRRSVTHFCDTVVTHRSVTHFYDTVVTHRSVTHFCGTVVTHSSVTHFCHSFQGHVPVRSMVTSEVMLT